MEMLSDAFEFVETWDEKEDVMNRLGSYIRHDWFHNSHSMMSKDAVDFMLSSSVLNTVPKADEFGQCLEEYLTFRKIVLWVVYQVLPPNDAKAEAVLEVLPVRNSPSLWQKLVKVPDIDHYLSELSTSTDVCDSTAVLNSLLGISVCRQSLEGLLLRHVNLSRMPQSLLLEIVHPLQMFPVRQLLVALLHSALQRSVRFARGFYLSTCSMRVGIGERIIRSDDNIVGKGVSMAVLALPETKSASSCKWSFKICHFAVNSIDFGVICEPAGRPLQLNQLYNILGGYLGDCSARILRVGRKRSKTLVKMRRARVMSKMFEGLGNKPEDENESEDGEESSENGKGSSESESENSGSEEVSQSEDFERTESSSGGNEKSSKDEYKIYEVFDTELGHNAEVQFTLMASKKRLHVRFNSRKAVWDDLPEGNYYPVVCFDNCPSGEVHFKLLDGFDNTDPLDQETVPSKFIAGGIPN